MYEYFVIKRFAIYLSGNKDTKLYIRWYLIRWACVCERERKQ
jgi:hypothetical protein